MRKDFFSGLPRWMGLVIFFVLALALAVPLFTEAEDVTPTADSYAVSGDPKAAPAEQAHVFTSRAAVSEQSDDGQTAVILPEVKVGESVPGGDVGDVVAEQPADISPVWERLEALSPDDKANALIEVEAGDGVSASEADAIENAEYLWNNGVFAQAIHEIRLLEESGIGLAVGINWKIPKAVVSADWMDTDVRIGARTNIQETHLDFDAQNGNQFAVLRYSGNWSVNISTDGGKTWQETYTWGGSVDDTSAAVVDNYFWVGYVYSSINDQGRMRRFHVSNGSVDTAYGYQTVFDKNVAIKEIAVATSADDHETRVYYYAILDQPAPLTTAEAAEAPAATNTETYAVAQQRRSRVHGHHFRPQMPIKMGDSDTVIRQLADSPKLNFPEEILASFNAGETTTRVIVDLRDPEPTPTRAVRPNFNDLAVREGVNQQVMAAQNEVIDSMDPNEVRITNRFTYIFGFSAEVTVEGLVSLVNHPDVIFIKEDGILEANLAQGIPLMNATTARNTYNGTGMAIAICDTGIDYNHSRLGGGSFPNSKVIGGWDCGQNDSNPIDGQGHGTSCAGIAAGDLGTVGDYIGGVAYNARLYALKITYSSTGGSAWESDFVEALEWCITHQNDDPNNPIMIISTSFGGYYYNSQSACDAYWPNMTTAAANAKAAGMTLFVSTGNDGFTDGTGWPGCLSDVVGVGAVYDANIGPYSGSCYDPTTAADQVTCYSSSAPFMSLFAPSHDAYTTALGGGYRTDFGGTSAACPYAAGAGAALQSAAMANSGAYLTPDQVQSILEDNGDLVTDPKAPTITKPRVNLGNAVAAIATDNLVFYWAYNVDTTTPTWVEFKTGVSNADSGLDATWNENLPSGYPLYASYIASEGATNPVMVLRTNNSVMEAIEVLSDYTGSGHTTSVSAYNDTIICAYEHQRTNGMGIQYHVSYNGGDTWSQGGSSFGPDPGHSFFRPDVTCRGGQGSAIVYSDEVGEPDSVWFRYRDHYSSGGWDAEVAEINEKDNFTGTPNRIEWLPPLAGSYAYGIIYISWDPDSGTPYFDRSDIAGGSYGAVDFDGDLKSDVAIYRQNGGWHIVPSSTGIPYCEGFGGIPNIGPVPGDYEGDGKTDLAFYTLAGGWYIKPSSGGGSHYYVGNGGAANDVPVQGDYDGDGKTDVAIYRQNGGWHIIPSSTGTKYCEGFGGIPNIEPVPGDYDGDGKTDLAFYTLAGGWYIKPSSGGGSHYYVGNGGAPNDIPVPGDYDGDGMTDCAVYRQNGGWHIVPSSTGIPYCVGFGGIPNIVPVPGDYDGDGKTDLAFYRLAGGWYIKPSSGGGSHYYVGNGGAPNDIPVNPITVRHMIY